MKPNIDDVYNAFCIFQSASRRAGINVEAHEKARAEFKTKLTEWGLADLIDWTDRGVS